MTADTSKDLLALAGVEASAGRYHCDQCIREAIRTMREQARQQNRVRPPLADDVLRILAHQNYPAYKHSLSLKEATIAARERMYT